MSDTREGHYVDLSGVRIFVDRNAYSPPIVEALENGSYEGVERGVLPRLLVAGDRVLEVGSALGCVTMAAARIVGDHNVLGFEANPAMVRDADSNFSANGVRIAVRNAVLQNRVCWSGRGSTIDFHVHKDFWASSLVAIPGTVGTVPIPTLCFEEEARQFGATTLICDIEGGEAGLLETADLTGFHKILLEIHYWSGRAAINRMLRRMMFEGFNIDMDLSGGSIVTLHRGLEPAARPQ